MLEGDVRVFVVADVLDRPGTPGDRLVPVYSGLLASGVVTVGLVSRMGRVVSIRELGDRVGVGEVRIGVHALARGVSPTRFSPVCVGGATGAVVRVLGVETLVRLDGKTELKIPVRLEPLGADRVGAVIVLRDRGDTTAGWSVRGEGDTVLVEGRAAGLAAGREMLTGALRV